MALYSVNNAAAKEEISMLVAKYNNELASDKLKKYTEEDVKKGFILPLFEALGWHTTDRSEVSSEEYMKSSGRVDYGFYLNDQPKFYLEAKSTKANIHDEQWARQAIRYSWNKGVTWAVLTNFEHLIVFNTQDIKSSLHNKKLFDISYADFASDFDKIWMLSRESFMANALDAYAESVGKKYQKIPISALLYKDLDECRSLLTKALASWNKEKLKGKSDLLDEGVQKLLDRLIFIRVAEDRGVEPPTLIPLVREWEASKTKNEVPLYASMVGKFRELDKIYNSNLFLKHPFEDWEEYSDATKEAIRILYGKEGYYEYDFKAMPADVLGTVYENYLGHRLSQSKKGVTLDKDASKRKGQGIYYTPSFIVDYIVQHALKPMLDKCTTMDQLLKIKVLDPACGSGSFLIKALEVLNEKYKELGQKGDETTKLLIITNNLYGVDLDEQAVEIARLNLCINSLDGKMKLPYLTDNIKRGNSLISGTDVELKKYFGAAMREKRPFNWEEEFPSVFAEGGFDIVIGNPPYVRNRELDATDKEYFAKQYDSAQGQYDLYQLFFERGVSVLKNNGLLGFITSNKYAIADYGKKLREFILENCKILSLIDVSNIDVFKDASTYPYVIVLEKNKNNAGNQIKCRKIADESQMSIAPEIVIDQDEIKKSSTQNFALKNTPDFFEKIEKVSARLGEIASIKETIHTGNVREKLIVNEKLDENCKKLLAGKDCHRYWFKWNGKWIRYDKSLIDKSKKEYANLVDGKYFEKPKILLREIALNIECCYDDERYYTLNKVYSVQPIAEYDLKYLLAVLNSKLLSFYFRHQFEDAHVSGGYLQFKKIYTSQIPVYRIDFSDKKEKAKHDHLVALGEKIVGLNKQLHAAEENSNEWEQLKSEIEKTDKKIDEAVYGLYGLTEEEIKAV